MNENVTSGANDALVDDPPEVSSRLVSQVTCPNCWHRFPPEDALFIARHDSLVGDPIAGEQAYWRFMPSRFTIDGDAIDARGMVCHQVACPSCHLEVTRPLIEMLPFFTSIVGAPASGKSYFLTALTWEMRTKSSLFGFSFTDGDPVGNLKLQEYEQALFLNADRNEPTALPKTAVHSDELYQTIIVEGQRQTFPRPFVFTIRPNRRYFDTRDLNCPFRSLVVYDNAGESFLPGADVTSTPVTLHMAESEAIFFVFDPTQDQRFHKYCRDGDPQMTHGLRPGSTAPVIRQEFILNEIASRVRRYKGLAQSAKHTKPLIVILAKADIWIKEKPFRTEPFISGEPTKLDIALIERISRSSRELMQKTCPELVSAAEEFSRKVIYVPVSSLGVSPEIVQGDDDISYGVRPENIKPKWVTVPLLWALHYCVPDLIKTT